MPSREQLAAWSQETGFRDEVLEKVSRLLDLLADINRHPLLSRVLVLKGGTALNLGFGTPRRLSVDLDFNYIGALDREAMEQERPRVEEALNRIAQAQDYQLQRSRPAHAGRTCFLNYHSALGSPDRIEVDLNFLHRQLLLPARVRTLWSPDPEAAVAVQMVSLPELWAGKLCALLDRMTPRDLFDVAHLPQAPFEAESVSLFRPIFIALSGTLPHPLYSYGRDRIQRLADESVQQHLYPTLIQGQEPTTEELLERAWARVEPFLQLEERERVFIDDLQNGELQPELLFPDRADLAARVSQHPALLWKARNAAIHRRRGI